MFNSSLGDIYLSQTPPKYNGVELSLENMIKFGAIFAAVIIGICFVVSLYIGTITKAQNEKLASINREIDTINQFLEANKDVSGSKFSEADEIRIGLSNNKNIYSYYTIVGTEIPKKLWLTSLELGEHTTIKGQADNLESIYSFYRNIKDYNPTSAIKLQKLGLATKSKLTNLSKEGDFDTASILTSLNADFYEFTISDVVEEKVKSKDKEDSDDDSDGNKKSKSGTPAKELEIIDEEE